MHPDPADQPALATDQGEKPLFVVTCRAEPENPNIYDDLALPAGDYQLAWAHPVQTTPNAPLSFTYDSWHYASHRKPLDDIADILPGGDVLIVVHGFLDTEPEGVYAGLQVARGLRRTGDPLAALSGQPPMSQVGALRLAKALNNRLSAAQPLYRHLIAFTWPTTHRISGYLLGKKEIAHFCAFSLANLINDLRATDPGRRIRLIGHSMGCFLVIKALNQLEALRSAQTPAEEAPVLVDQMIFYAADINCDALQSSPALARGSASSPGQTFIAKRRNGYGYQALNRVGRLTIYYSFHDNILIWAPLVNPFSEEAGGAAGGARLGWGGPLNIATTHKNVVVVDCSACIYDHAAYFVRHEVLEHTRQTLTEPVPEVPEPAIQAPALPTTAEGTQRRAHRLWTWYTPLELVREGWERFFYRKPAWVRAIGAALGWLLALAVLAGLITSLIVGIIALIHALF